MKPTSMLIILLFAFTLAACGGGGGSSSVPNVPDDTMMPTPEDVTPSVDLMDLAVPANDYMIAAGETMNVGAGESEVTLSCSAAAACAFTVAADGTATATTGEVTAALSSAAMQAIADREAMEMEAANAARQAKVMALTEAIADPDGDGKFPENNELSTDKRPGMEPTYGAGGATTVDMDALGKNDPAIRNTVEFQAKTESRIALSGYKSSVHERTKDGKTDTLTVYNNAASDKGQVFNAYYGQASTDGETDRAAADTSIASIAANSATADPAKTFYNVITFANTANLRANGRPVTGSGFPSNAPTGETTSKTTDGGDMFTGMFHGVPGKFMCATGTDCEIEDSDDGLQITAGTLTFTPTETINDTQDAHMIAGAIKDGDYLSFGYWVQSMPTGSGMKYGVNTFAGGSMPYAQAEDGTFATDALNALQGTATYEGDATGLYARKDLAVVDGAVVGTPAETGQFSANVELTAHFGNTATTGVDTDHISASELYSISGTVDNFQDANGDMISNWDLPLNSTALRSGASDAYTGGFTGDTGSGAMKGQWRGALFGDSTADADAGETAATMYPSGVTGEFTGHFTDGHVIGAFGATR